MEGRARLRQAAVLQRPGQGRGATDRHRVLPAFGAAPGDGLRRLRRRPRHRPRDPDPHGTEPGAGGADLLPGAVCQHRVFIDAGVFPRHPAGLLGRGAVRDIAVDLQPVLHHRRPVDVRQVAAAGAVLRLRGRAGHGQVPGPAGAGGDRLAPGARGALLPHPVPGGNRQGLRAHRACQGTGRARGAAAPRAAQRHAADPDQHRGRLAAAVHGQPDRRILLRHSGPGQLHHRRHQRAGLLHRARHGVPGRVAVHRGADPGRHFLHAGRPRVRFE